MFAVAVILRLCFLKILHISFLIASTCWGGTGVASSPSSLYNPMLAFLMWESFESKNKPTSSHVSAPSKEPCATSIYNVIYLKFEKSPYFVDFFLLDADIAIY